MKITAPHLAALAVAAIDGLEAVGTRGPFQTGTDFITGTIIDTHGRDWLVKYPLNSLAATALEAEAALAPELLQELRLTNLPFDIMRPAGFTKVQTGRAVIYSEPFGTPLDFNNMTAHEARAFARALAAIHSLPPTVIEQAGLPSYTSSEWRERLLAELTDADHETDIPVILRRRWEDILNETSLWDFTPCVVHGDLAGENFLWSNTQISTVIGWGEAHVGDAAQDLASLLSLPDDILLPILSSYENTRGITLDNAMRTRAIFMNEFSLLRWLMYGIHTDNSDVRNEATDMINDLADQIALDPDHAPGPAWHIEVDQNSIVPPTNNL